MRIKGITQEELGEMVGVSRKTIVAAANGQRTPNACTLAEICRVLDCSADYLLGLSNRPRR